MRCPICNKIYSELTLGHVRTHGYNSFSDFQKDYPLYHRKALVWIHRQDTNLITAHQDSFHTALQRLRKSSMKGEFYR